MIKTLIITIACISFIIAEDAKEIPSLKPILGTYEADSKKLWDAYQAGLAKASDKAKVAMDSKMKEAMKRGDLEGATAIKAKMDELTNGKILSDLEGKWQEAKNDLIGVDDGKKDIVGTWKVLIDNQWEFTLILNKDNTASTDRDNRMGTWEVKGKKLIIDTVASNGREQWIQDIVPRNGDKPLVYNGTVVKGTWIRPCVATKSK